MNRVIHPAPPPVSIFIINFNGRDFLECLCESLFRQTYPHFEVSLIDNGSTDGSCPFVAARFPRVRIVETGVNLGFARAANLGAMNCSTPYFALLNTDLRLEPDWLARLVKAVEADEEIAAVAPKMLFIDQPRILNGVGGKMNRLGYTWDRGMFEEDRGQFDCPAEVLFAPAAASLFRTRVFQELGGFDERFFMYHEDVDFGWRCWLTGHRIVTTPSSVVYHHFGGTTRASESLLWREVLGERNNICSLIKNYEAFNSVRALFRLLLLKQRWPRKLAQLRNLVWNLLRLPETLRIRRSVQQRRTRRDSELEHLIVQSPNIPVRL